MQRSAIALQGNFQHRNLCHCFRQPFQNSVDGTVTNKRRLCFLGVLLFAAASLHFTAPMSPANAAADTEKVLFEDRFDSKLADGWSWIREEPDAWRIESDELRIRSLPGGLYRNMNDCKNLLLRPLPAAADSPLIVEVTLHCRFKGQFEHAGIVWYLNDDDYIVVSKEYYTKGAEPAVQMVREEIVDGKMFSKVPHHIPFDDDQVSLRLVIDKTAFTGQYRRADADDWKSIGTIHVAAEAIKHAAAKDKPRIGLVTSFGTREEQRWVRFTNFRILK